MGAEVRKEDVYFKRHDLKLCSGKKGKIIVLQSKFHHKPVCVTQD